MSLLRTLGTISLIFLGLVTADPASAQMQFGGFAGLSLSSIWGDDADDADWRAGPTFGLQLVQQSESVFGFETGAAYVSKGTKAREGTTRITLKVPYIEVPALLRIALPLEGTTFRPVITAGGAVAFKTGCKVSVADSGATLDLDCDAALFEGELDLKSVDFGITGGLSFDIPAGSSLLVSPSARYTLGLANIDDSGSGDEVKNRSFQFYLALRTR